jgi:hypothetical protein
MGEAWVKLVIKHPTALKGRNTSAMGEVHQTKYVTNEHSPSTISIPIPNSNDAPKP